MAAEDGSGSHLKLTVSDAPLLSLPPSLPAQVCSGFKQVLPSLLLSIFSPSCVPSCEVTQSSDPLPECGPGQLCVAQFSQDGCWYRAVVVDTPKPGVVRCTCHLYIHEGNANGSTQSSHQFQRKKVSCLEWDLNLRSPACMGCNPN